MTDATFGKMRNMHWNDGMLLGVPRMDDDHRDLAGRIAGCAAANDQELRFHLQQLAAATGRHFADEEHLMECIGFAGIGEHRKQHALQMLQLHRLLEDAAAGRVDDARRGLAAFRDWFLHHVATMDAALAAGVTGAPARAAAPGAEA